MKKLILWFLKGGKDISLNATRNGHSIGVEVGLSTDARFDCTTTISLAETFYTNDGASLVLQFNVMIYAQFLMFYFIFHAHTKRYYL